MSSVVVSGDTSGAITIAAPSISGTNTLTLPAVTDTLVGLAATQTLTNKTLTTPNLGTPSTLVLTNATGLAAAAMPAGSVLQVVSTNITSTFSTSSSSYTDITSLSVTITPSSASNKILVSVNVPAGVTAATYGAMLQLVRGSTAIGNGTAAGSRTACATEINEAMYYAAQTNAWTYLDSPSTTASTTYKIQIISQSGGTVYVNRSYEDTDAAWRGRSSSNITVMEIKG
jgi:hypothetical protein